MISRRSQDARDAAAYRAEVTGDEELGKRIRAMFLRDMRNFAANLAEDIDEASKLQDHSNVNVTRRPLQDTGCTLEGCPIGSSRKEGGSIYS